MNRWLKIIYKIAILLFFYWGFVPKYDHVYIYSKKGNLEMTALTYPNTWYKANETYFTPGYYRNWRIPDIYVKPNYTLERDWNIYVTFHSRGIFFLGNAEVKNISDSFFYMPNSITAYRENWRIDSIIATFKNAEDTSFYWSSFR